MPGDHAGLTNAVEARFVEHLREGQVPEQIGLGGPVMATLQQPHSKDRHVVHRQDAQCSPDQEAADGHGRALRHRGSHKRQGDEEPGEHEEPGDRRIEVDEKEVERRPGVDIRPPVVARLQVDVMDDHQERGDAAIAIQPPEAVLRLVQPRGCPYTATIAPSLLAAYPPVGPGASAIGTAPPCTGRARRRAGAG